MTVNVSMILKGLDSGLRMNRDLDIARFFSSDVAAAAGVDVATLQNWLRRGVVELAPSDRDAEGLGTRRLLSLRTAIQIVLMTELTRIGIDPRTASLYAAEWTKTDELAKRGEEDEDVLLVVQPERGAYAAMTMGTKMAVKKIFHDQGAPDLRVNAVLLLNLSGIVDTALLKLRADR